MARSRFRFTRTLTTIFVAIIAIFGLAAAIGFAIHEFFPAGPVVEETAPAPPPPSSPPPPPEEVAPPPPAPPAERIVPYIPPSEESGNHSPPAPPIFRTGPHAGFITSPGQRIRLGDDSWLIERPAKNGRLRVTIARGDEMTAGDYQLGAGESLVEQWNLRFLIVPLGEDLFAVRISPLQ